MFSTRLDFIDEINKIYSLSKPYFQAEKCGFFNVLTVNPKYSSIFTPKFIDNAKNTLPSRAHVFNR